MDTSSLRKTVYEKGTSKAPLYFGIAWIAFLFWAGGKIEFTSDFLAFGIFMGLIGVGVYIANSLRDEADSAAETARYELAEIALREGPDSEVWGDFAIYSSKVYFFLVGTFTWNRGSLEEMLGEVFGGVLCEEEVLSLSISVGNNPGVVKGISGQWRGVAKKYVFLLVGERDGKLDSLGRVSGIRSISMVDLFEAWGDEILEKCDWE